MKKRLKQIHLEIFNFIWLQLSISTSLDKFKMFIEFIIHFSHLTCFICLFIDISQLNQPKSIF